MSDDHRADLSYVDAATDSIATHLRGGELIILESTSPPGTTKRIADRIMTMRPDLTWEGGDRGDLIQFAHCPERVLPGRIVVEMVTNDRIIGGLTPAAAERARKLYALFCRGDLHLTDASTAEMVKLTENAFRDVNIAFANELSIIADRLGIDPFEVIQLANKHPRVNILQPGPGVGGHCIAVDPWFIVESAPEEAQLIRTARRVNDAKPELVVDKILEACEPLSMPIVVCLGLSFKADVDDLRGSPAMKIVESLSRRASNATVYVVEPHISYIPEALSTRSNVYLKPLEDALQSAHVVALLVDHKEFYRIDHEALNDKVLIDVRGVWSHTIGKTFRSQGGER